LTYDETLSHRIQAGADILLMPSRYEPCGLTQMYSLRYGTIPVVRRTGGLADTISDSTPVSLQAGTATGFCFNDATSTDFLQASRAAIASYQAGSHWQQIMQTAMLRDFTWKTSAEKYVNVYLDLLQKQPHPELARISQRLP